LVFVADSFAGLPPPKPDRYPKDAGSTFHSIPELAISSEEVKANFARYDLLDDQVVFLEGFFDATLPLLSKELRFSLLRLDGDMYESTIVALECLYPKLSVGGFCIIDDYGAIPQCREAVDDYRAKMGISESLHQIDWTGVWWQKER
jgi:O-methyltransferase